MGSINFDTIESKSLQLGDCKFEQGSISVAGKETITAGTILKRGSNGKFIAAKDGDDLVAVVPFDMKNEKNEEANFGFRAIISGPVRKDMLVLDGSPITSEQADSLRDFGIIAVETTDVSRINP